MISTKDKVKAIQIESGAYPDGHFGPQSVDYTYRRFAKPKLPYRVKLFGQWCFIADPKKVNPFNPEGKRVNDFANTVSGSYSYARKPISILVSNGKTIRDYSCHCWEKRNGKTHFPESVLWYNKDGSYGLSQVTKDVHLPDRENIVWAIGGAGMNGNLFQDPWSKLWIPGDAKTEYFYEKFGDVWRDTNHIMIGFDTKGYLIAVECYSMNGQQMVDLAKKLGFVHDGKIMAIKLDGGHVAASNVDGRKLNQYQAQYYAIQLS